MVEKRGRNPCAARNLARNRGVDQWGASWLYRSNSLNRQGCFSQTLLLPGCSSTQASPRWVPRAFQLVLILTLSILSTTSMSDRKAVIKNADMSEEMQQVKIQDYESESEFWRIHLLIPGCCRLRHPGLGEVQHREGHCSLHQEGVWQEVRQTNPWQDDQLIMISARYNPTWHCIVGRNFGSYVTHETRLVEILIYDNNIGSYILCCFNVPNIQAFHLLLPWPSGHPPLQERLDLLLTPDGRPLPNISQTTPTMSS